LQCENATLFPIFPVAGKLGGSVRVADPGQLLQPFARQRHVTGINHTTIQILPASVGEMAHCNHYN